MLGVTVYRQTIKKDAIEFQLVQIQIFNYVVRKHLVTHRRHAMVTTHR
jgi:hypothetical protein